MKMGGGTRSSITSHGGNRGSLCKFTLVFFVVLVAVAEAQQTDPQDRQQYPRFSPSMAVIVVVLVSALFFMAFFSIYIRHCSDSSGATGSLGRALSMRARRAAASRGLDRAVLETFPTFPYAEVKDHKIGKGALECAVCLNEFEPDETLRLLPKCDHVFHTDCIDAWLESHVTCPVCRANLAVAAEDPVLPQAAEEAPPPAEETTARSGSTRNEEIVIQVAAEDPAPNRNTSFEYPNRPPRSWSTKMQRMLSFSKFRSHSTGHSVVQPAQNLDRFTLRLPAHVRKDMIDRAMLNRTRSLAIASTLPRESSSRIGYRGEGSSRGGRSNRRIDVASHSRSDRWSFFTRALSMKSPKVRAESSQGNKGSLVKMASFKCLEPKANTGDEINLISKQESDHSPV